MNKYKHLFFDLDNTLFDFTASEHIVLRNLYEKHLQESEFEDVNEFIDIYAVINKQLWADYHQHKVSKHDVKYGRFKDTLMSKGINNEALYTEMGDSFVMACTENNTLVEGALEVIEALSKKYQLHIISNGFIEAQYRKLEITGLRPYFKGITLSEEIKVQKPNKPFFQHAFKTVNARKSESLIIGDTWDSDIVGAMNFGVDAIFFSYFGEKAKKSEIKTIFKLNELLSFLL